MALSFIEEVQRRVREKTGMFATWLPTDVMNVGDFGRIKKGRFVSEGNTKSLGVNFKEEIHKSESSKFGFSDRAEITFKNEFSIDSNDHPIAKCEIVLKGKGSFVYQLDNLVSKKIEDKSIFYKELILLIINRRVRWSDSFVVVDAVRGAGSATIIVSESDEAGIVLNGGIKGDLDGEVPLAKLLGRISAQVQKGSLFQAICAKLTTPLYNPRRISFKTNDEGEGNLSAMASWFLQKFGRHEILPDEVSIKEYSSNDEDDFVTFFDNRTNAEFSIISRKISIRDFIFFGGNPDENGPHHFDSEFGRSSSTNVLRNSARLRKTATG